MRTSSEQSSLGPPADLSADQLLERAWALAPVLAGRAAAAEELRQLPPETLADFAAADFQRVMVPRRFGGLELGFPTLAAITRVLARGCPSSAWLLAFYGLHNYLLALTPEATQAEVFADHPYALAPATFAPNGTAQATEDGYLVTGRWSWASGVMHSDWALVAARMIDGSGPSLAMFLLPMSDVTVEDVWHTSGMRATGSNDMVVDGAFVPTRRMVPFADIVEGTAPGVTVNESRLYRTPLVPMLAMGAATPALGLAEATVDQFQDRVGERVIAYTAGTVQRDLPAAQIRLGRAAAAIAAAGAAFDRAVAEIDELGDRTATVADRARLRLTAAHVVDTARTVITDLVAASGGSAQLLTSPFQRALRDVTTLAGHVIFDFDATCELYGRVRVGLDVPRGTLV